MEQLARADIQGLKAAISPARRLLVFLHDNPDPDAITAGWLLAKIAESLGKRASLVYGGRLGRAENRTMVKALGIPLRHIGARRIRYLNTDRYALVDTQPGTGNNSFPAERLRSHVVIDHHPSRAVAADFVDVRSEVGCCTTLLLGYHEAAGLVPDPDLATAAAYAILSETQDLKREATRADREAYQRIFPHVRLGVLGRIRHPVRSRSYFRTIARAMQRVQVGRNTCVCHMGGVDAAELVAELADLLAAMERISWCLVSGLHGRQMVMSIRTNRACARADRVIQRMIGKLGAGGGHDMIAGGSVDCGSADQYPELAERMTASFLRQIRRRQPERLRPLLSEALRAE
ncbi:MAG: DHH family phosphoesterase [Deltaproteobacteria bacterium]|nr:DHH family phosphoesterase [Deltaproteobacteria bacterium]